ncbi:MAG: hypothetical protein OXU50_00195 [Gammaproteobacteria bacterium]|nr:hypothetical protein [Gammaproteobacteria bacterium]MDD9807713.1 hypothetical protein [Gammaproteobacteria bacterium]MDD9868310.1 hypothetical protein [Gammaproteobacteria bacterium]MDD9886479.1 hypothetical protein [Gammaproteobacteria bacterium]
MKKLYLTVACSALVLTGCSNMQMMHDMKEQMSEMQYQLNSIETSSARAKEMASEAMIKASQMEQAMTRMVGKSKMKQMMK